MVDGKMLFDIPENKSVFWGIKWYPDSVLIVAFDEESSRIVSTREEAYEIIKNQLSLSPSIFYSGQEGDEEKLPYCLISVSNLMAKLPTNLPVSTIHDDFIFGSSRSFQSKNGSNDDRIMTETM